MSVLGSDVNEIKQGCLWNILRCVQRESTRT